MKKHFVILAAAVAALFAACTKETPNVDVTPVGMVKVELTAGVEGATKTTYDADGKFSWTEGDQISVLCSDDNIYTFTAKSSAAKSVFVGEIPAGVTVGSQAFFPANENHAMNTYHVASVATLHGAGQAALPMVGDKLEDGSFTFSHITGAYKFTVENIPADYTSVEVTIATSSLKLSGTFGIYHGSDDKWAWSAATTDVDNEKTYVRTVDVAEGKAVVYLPYCKYNLWGTTTITVVAYDAENQAKTLLPTTEVSGLGDVNCARATVYPVKPFAVPEQVEGIDWNAEGIQTATLSENFIAEQPGKLNLTELKAFADKENLYVRLKVADPTESSAMLRYYFAAPEGSNTVWYWEKDAFGDFIKSSKFKNLAITYGSDPVAVTTEVIEGETYWQLVFPRAAHALTASAGSVKIGFLTYTASEAETGFMPQCWTNMMEVTLP